MRYYLNPRTGVRFYGTFSDAWDFFGSDFFIGCNAQGNTCQYNGDRVGHSKGFCTADACY